MTKKIYYILILIFVFIFASCSKSGQAGNSGEIQPFSDQELNLEKNRWGEGNIPGAEANIPGLVRDVYFEFDSSTIASEFRENLRDYAKSLDENSDLIVQVEGHCDKRGTSEYNMALGEKRARAVAEVLAGYGADKSQITWVSYGEEIPVDPADDESAYAKNRRAHLGLYRKGNKS